MKTASGMTALSFLLVLSAPALSLGDRDAQNVVNGAQASAMSPTRGATPHKYTSQKPPDLPVNPPQRTLAAFSERARELGIETDLSEPSHNATWPMSGTVVPWPCQLRYSDTCEGDDSYTVRVPADHVVLISFPVFDLDWSWMNVGAGFVELLSVHRNGDTTLIWKNHYTRMISPAIYATSVRLRLFIPRAVRLGVGFKMVFSIHPASHTPHKIGKGLFNCSVPFYDTFKLHFHCNMRNECLGGEDEGQHCVPSCVAFKGKMAVGNKCYFPIRRARPVRWTTARRLCQKQGADLATMKTAEEWDALRRLLHRGDIVRPVFVGMHSYDPRSMPSYYRYSDMWIDGVVNYRMGTIQRNRNLYGRICLYFRLEKREWFQSFLTYISCEERAFADFVCEYELLHNITTNSSEALLHNITTNSSEALLHNITTNSSEALPAVYTSSSILTSGGQSLVRCPAGHVTHDFLSCDPDSRCRAEQHVSQCQTSSSEDPSLSYTITMFVCDDRMRTLPYTLVCDFREDCDDGSDEVFCIHRGACNGFLCKNGQCISISKRCDNFHDCWDGSDEQCLYHFLIPYGIKHLVQPPAIISFDRNAVMTQSPLVDGVCPETHFVCPEGYCLPLFCRCNGLGDCLDKSDEEDCHDIQCRGYYRCRSSSVCVHADHLCDGLPQCPQRDDEWLCEVTCPETCTCQGHAFLCAHYFDHAAYPSVRYLDATGSGMALHDFVDQGYLVWLSLARCGLRQLAQVDILNIRTLNLSGNLLTSLDMDTFLSLRNMRVLDLSHNPLVFLVSQLSKTAHPSLVSIDLSGIPMTTFNTTVLANYPMIRVLRLVHSSVTRISEDGFLPIRGLAHLDLSGSKINDYPSDIFRGLHHLRTADVGNYKLCCKDLLPQGFDLSQCFAPRDDLSSCADLLRSDTYRTFLWLFSVLSLAGNMGCLVTRLCLLKNKSLTAFSIFVTNLSIADFLMGVYLGMVGTADYVYRGKYFWYEKTWKPSVACQIAGFLSLLSSETSAFIICLITLDRFLVLSSPFSEVRFTRKTAEVICLFVWFFGLSLAAVPLLPATAQWEFYSQTGICIPLPITRKAFKGRNYALGVIIIFNLVLFLLIATGQAMIYWTIRTTSMAQSSTRKTKDLTIARRLLSVVVSDFLCWFPIGFLGLLAANGTPISGEVNVGMAIFVLPLNAALNPFLYTFKALTERWKKMEEKQLIKQLEARCHNPRGDK